MAKNKLREYASLNCLAETFVLQWSGRESFAAAGRNALTAATVPFIATINIMERESRSLSDNKLERV